MSTRTQPSPCGFILEVGAGARVRRPAFMAGHCSSFHTVPSRRLSLGALAGGHLCAPADAVRPQVQSGHGAFGVRPSASRVMDGPPWPARTNAGPTAGHRTAPGSRSVCRRRSHRRDRRRAQPVDDIAVLAARSRDRHGADRGSGPSELAATARNSAGDRVTAPVSAGRVPVSSPHAPGPRARPATYRARPHPGHDTGPRPHHPISVAPNPDSDPAGFAGVTPSRLQLSDRLRRTATRLQGIGRRPRPQRRRIGREGVPRRDRRGVQDGRPASQRRCAHAQSQVQPQHAHQTHDFEK